VIFFISLCFIFIRLLVYVFICSFFTVIAVIFFISLCFIFIRLLGYFFICSFFTVIAVIFFISLCFIFIRLLGYVFICSFNQCLPFSKVVTYLGLRPSTMWRCTPVRRH
jgi:hypothetical protein